jgi:hypothetical protein
MSPGGMRTTAGNPRSAAPAGGPRPPTRADADSTPFPGFSAAVAIDQGRVRSPDHPHLDADGCGSVCAGRVRSRRPGQAAGPAAWEGGPLPRTGRRAGRPCPRCLPAGRFKDRGSGAVDHPASRNRHRPRRTDRDEGARRLGAGTCSGQGPRSRPAGSGRPPAPRSSLAVPLAPARASRQFRVPSSLVPPMAPAGGSPTRCA